MSKENEMDYGPLTGLIGIWKGNKGFDVAPEPVGRETNDYYETITYTAAGEVTNAEDQVLAVLRYHQVVQRQTNDEIFHNESGYWMWDARENTVMHTFVIPRGVAVMAGGIYRGATDSLGRVIIEVEARLNDKDWGIIQSPFMQEKASTTGFRHAVIVGNGTMSYSETTIVDIYGRSIKHTDDNELVLQ